MTDTQALRNRVATAIADAEGVFMDQADAAIAVCMEEAAKVADEAVEKYAALTYDKNHSREQNAAKTYCADEIGVSIRSLKPKTEG